MDLERLEAITLVLPEAVRVDIEAWGDEVTYRVRKKNFVFTHATTTTMSVKLSLDEAEAVIATEPGAEPTGYGMGRYGWVSVDVGDDPDWEQITEWVRTSYTLVAPKTLAKQVLEEDGLLED
jgi:predicted DNA-binding protein (MmcQ/YjbR family)